MVCKLRLEFWCASCCNFHDGRRHKRSYHNSTNRFVSNDYSQRGCFTDKDSRNLGQFVARIKFVNATGERATPFQGMLSNSVGIFALFGLLFVFVSTSKFGDKDAGAGPIVWTVIGAIFLILYIVNWQFAKASQYNQGLYDVIFGAFLVKHVPTKEEKASGFWEV